MLGAAGPGLVVLVEQGWVRFEELKWDVGDAVGELVLRLWVYCLVPASQDLAPTLMARA